MTEAEIRAIITGHISRNRELLQTIESNGVSITRERSIDHHFWANSRNEASLLAKELYDQGYLVSVISPVTTTDDSILWNVEATSQQSLVDATNTHLVETLVRLAAKFDAVYDGWGTSI